LVFNRSHFVVQSRDPKRILFIGNEVDADVYGAKGCV
jgi:hypothetical protein